MTKRLLRAALLPLTLLLLGAPAVEAVPLPPGSAGFGISPARRDVVGLPPLALTSTNVSNRTTNAYRVTVFPAILTQTLTGAFDFPETSANLRNSQLVLSAAPARFDLAPGANRLVSLRWNLLPLGHKSIVMGVVFQGVSEGQAGTVHVITRLLSVNFLSTPGLTNVNGDFTGLYAQQFGKRVLRFTSRVENTGNRFWAPTDGRLTIRNSSGTVAYSAPWAGSVVIPGAQVDFPVDVRQLLPAGQYTATTTMQFGSHHRSRSTSFTLVGPNQLPTPGITIRGFNATGEIGSPANLTAQIISSGTAPASVTVRLYLSTAQGGSALANGTVSYTGLAPGRKIQLSRSLGGALHKGFYRAVLSWTDPTGAQHTLESDFTATQPRSAWDSFWKWIGDHIVLFIVLLVLALLLIAAELARRTRRRQQQMEAELAAARAQLRTDRIHGRAVVVGERLSGRRPAPAAPAAAAEPEPEPEPIPQPAIQQPEREPASDAPEPAPVGEEPAPLEPQAAAPEPEPVATPTASETAPAPSPDWVPPWERNQR